MHPFEVLTSESQERMLVVVKPGDVAEALAVCERMGLPSAMIGEVTAGSRLEVREKGRIVADVPAASLGDGPLYDRPWNAPAVASGASRVAVEAPRDPADAFLKLMSCPNIASKLWAWEQYDHQVMLGTVVPPGHDAAVLRLPGTESRIAATTDGNGRWCFLDPYLGTRHTVAEAARNLSCLGASPAAVTNCLNFGNPELPEVMGQFVESVRGLGDACRELSIPVVSGNVSFYNQTGEQAIHPTPVVGMVGIVPKGVRPPGAGFASSGDLVSLLGFTKDELGGSEYLASVLRRTEGPLPQLDLKAEAAVQQAVRLMAAEGLLRSAHDCSSGGLAAALAESCVMGQMGARVSLEPSLPAHIALFSESASRVLVSFSPGKRPAVEKIAASMRVGMSVLGETGGDTVAVEGVLDVSLSRLSEAYRSGFSGAVDSLGYPGAS